MIETIRFSSPIGKITIIISDSGISQVILGDTTPTSDSGTAHAALLLRARDQMLEYFAGNRKSFDLPLDWSSIMGFQRDVLTLTNGIAYGEVMTYGQIARQLGKPNSSRAVGGALSRNPIPIIIPCHRVVAASGALTGYTGAGGLTTKQWLLEKEGCKVVNQKLA
jgi:methylated-DNA-[protein]-cysteine S-methyltransferase